MKEKLRKISKEYINGFISLLYPHFCVVCNKEINNQNEHLCFVCEQELNYTYFEKYADYTAADEIFWGRLNVENVYSMLYYSKGNSTQKILHHIKYKEGKELGYFMGKVMGRKMKSNPKYSSISGLIPIPLHSKKEFIRGYNQSLLIVKGLSEELDVPVVEALYRKTHDVSQTKKSKEERYKNVKGKFAAKEELLNEHSHVLIVDDVLTTGSTLEFASRAIIESSHSTKVSLATIAIAHS